MEQLNAMVESQYHLNGLYEDILTRLGEQEVDIDEVSRKHIAGVDEFHVRGAEISQELAREIGLDNSKVLDVGCGIGGPSRMLADDYNCRVTGIDLSHEFIRTASALSELVGLQDKTDFIQASALELPFEDGSFDVVWTQHVQMNISDKAKFYSEINRVLSDRGTFVYYDIFQKNGRMLITRFRGQMMHRSAFLEAPRRWIISFRSWDSRIYLQPIRLPRGPSSWLGFLIS